MKICSNTNIGIQYKNQYQYNQYNNVNIINQCPLLVLNISIQKTNFYASLKLSNGATM